VEVVLDKLKKIKNADLLCSNPCFELWYLLHFANQKAELTNHDCVSKLNDNVNHYQKGNLDDKLKEQLHGNKAKAIQRAKSLPDFTNPSTSIYKFVEELDNLHEK
jgi:predicted nucleotidyltransferase component of viral defense system